MRRALPFLILLLGLAGHFQLQARPAWAKITAGGGGRDFASYYYAGQVALAGGDPYDTPALSAAAVKDRTRKSVHPFFYPPPYLLTTAWVGPFSLQSAYQAWFFVNEAALAGCLTLGVLSFGMPLWVAALLLCTWTPIPDNAWMGQANLVALLPALGGLALAKRRPVLGGVLVGTAAMLKMSPALFLLYWALKREWRPVLAAMATAVALTVLSLPLVPFDAQWRFYTEVLPGFPRGDYHGLSVDIGLPANHSVPDLFDRAFPAKDRFLSSTAHALSTASTLALLGLWAWVVRRAKNEAAALGALTVLMVAVPVYTYEHHLVFLLAAVGAAAGAVQAAGREAWRKRRWMSAVGPWLVLVLVWFFLAWPLGWLRSAQAGLPDGWGWLTRESKTMAEAGLFALCLWAAARSPSAGAEGD